MNIIILVRLMAIALVIYLSIAFVTLEVNPMVWETVTRYLLIVFTIAGTYAYNIAYD